MTDEALSALLDGECSPAELDRLLGMLERDPALQARFSRLTLAREALRGTRIKAAHGDLAGRVAAALGQETAPSTVVPFRPRRALAWRPLAGLAAAAGLAAVAVLALRPDTQAPAADVLAADQSPASAQGADRHWTELDAENSRRLNNYLAAHSRSRAEQGVGATLSHARYAAHSAESPAPDPSLDSQTQEINR